MQDDIAERLAKADQLAAKAIDVFKPRTPITVRELFAGRWGELTTIRDAVHQPGLHIVIYGERGVGKTSLANVVRPTIWALDNFGKESPTDRMVVNCVGNSMDTFSTIWHKLFSEVQWPDGSNFLSTVEAFTLPDELTIDQVRKVLNLTHGAVYIVDEFDKTGRDVSKQFTELIKTLSDVDADCTIILVGVAETVDNLIADHASINRAVIQVRLDRMKPSELVIILENAEKILETKFSADATNLIVHISQGLPHYTHLVGLNAVRSAAHRISLHEVDRSDVFDALKTAVKHAEQSISEKHTRATHSSHKNALYRPILLACALAAARSHETLGYFNQTAVLSPLAEILKRSVTNATCSNHLAEFCTEKRANVLERDGQPWGYRYRFNDPLMVPYIFMDGIDKSITSGQGLVEMLSGKTP